jgi:cytochrome b561
MVNSADILYAEMPKDARLAFFPNVFTPPNPDILRRNSHMRILMSKIAHVLLIVLTVIFFNAGFSMAGDAVDFKYFFSDAFYNGDNPLGAE